jgi:hypothetical protein
MMRSPFSAGKGGGGGYGGQAQRASSRLPKIAFSSFVNTLRANLILAMMVTLPST